MQEIRRVVKEQTRERAGVRREQLWGKGLGLKNSRDTRKRVWMK